MKPLILVTGASGFLGSALRERLSNEVEIHAVDLRYPRDRRKAEHWHLVDITDANGIAQVFSRLDRPLAGLVHFAWYYDFSNRPHPRYAAAVDGLGPLAEAFGRQATPKAPFVFSSSMAAMAPTVPGVPQSPSSPSAGGWQYPQSKVLGERALRSARIVQPRVELVLAAVYSEYGELVPLYQSIERIRLGSFQRCFFPARTDRGLTYVHLADAVQAVVDALRADYDDSAGVLRFLVGERRPVTNQAIFDAATGAFGRHRVPWLRVPPNLAKLGTQLLCALRPSNFVQPWMIPFAEEHFEFDISQTTAALHWEPKRDLATTLPVLLSNAKTRTDEWIRRNEGRPWRRDTERDRV